MSRRVRRTPRVPQHEEKDAGARGQTGIRAAFARPSPSGAGLTTLRSSAALAPRRRPLAVAIAAIVGGGAAFVGPSDALPLGTPLVALGAPHFVDETATAGID